MKELCECGHDADQHGSDGCEGSQIDQFGTGIEWCECVEFDLDTGVDWISEVARLEGENEKLRTVVAAGDALRSAASKLLSAPQSVLASNRYEHAVAVFDTARAALDSGDGAK